MERVDENRDFLEQVMRLKTTARKNLIKKCSDENLKTLIEICLNLNSFPYNNHEIKDLKQAKSLLNQLIKKRKASLTSFRNLLITKHSVLPIIVSTILSKISEGAFCKLFNENDSF
jgi:hypothetical protein